MMAMFTKDMSILEALQADPRATTSSPRTAWGASAAWASPWSPSRTAPRCTASTRRGLLAELNRLVSPAEDGKEQRSGCGEAAQASAPEPAGDSRGQVIITERAIADIVGWTVLECYGVVGHGLAEPAPRGGRAADARQAAPGHQGRADSRPPAYQALHHRGVRAECGRGGGQRPLPGGLQRREDDSAGRSPTSTSTSQGVRLGE